jgi:multiple sugar transport system substrate-binding protein
LQKNLSVRQKSLELWYLKTPLTIRTTSTSSFKEQGGICMKKYLGILLLLTLVIALPLVAGGQQTRPQSGQQVVLRFSWWGGEARHNAFLEAIELFQSRNPNIRVEPEFGGWDGYVDRLLTQSAARQQPDVFMAGVDGPWLSLPVRMFADLEANRNLISWDQYDQDQVNMARRDGVLVGIPRSASGRGYLINKTLFDRLGIPIPNSSWTWDDFARVAQQVYDRSNGQVFGTLDETGGITYNSFGGPAFMLSNFNTQLITVDGLQLTRDQHIQYYQWWARLRASGASSSPEVSVAADANQNSPLVTGRVAMIASSSGTIGQFQSNTRDELVFLPLPVGQFPNDEASPGVVLSISADTPHKEAAFRFANFWANDPDALRIIGTEQGVPASSRAIEILLSGQLERVPAMQFSHVQYLNANRQQRPIPIGHPAQTEFMNRVWAEEQRLAFGRATIPETVDAIRRIATELGISVR